MSDKMQELVEAIKRWQSKEVTDYWLSVGYMGSAVNRLGDHDMTFVDDQLYHFWNDKWREIDKGKDYWLFSVPGGLAWARDMIKLEDNGTHTLELAFNEAYGYVEYMRVQALEGRDQHNFTFEVRRFGPEPHPNFEGTS